MKKFCFSLETVKKYKENLLEGLKGEYGQRMAVVRTKEEEIVRLESEKNQVSRELNQKNASGISSMNLGNYQRYLHVLRARIQQEYMKLEELYRLAEEKKDEMIEAKKEVEIFSRIKENQMEEHLRADAKEQELFAEEFVMRGYCSR